jgi:hypothetical protein
MDLTSFLAHGVYIIIFFGLGFVVGKLDFQKVSQNLKKFFLRNN